MPTPTEQLLSRTIYDTDGTTTNWNFSFASGYLDAAHVKAYTENAAGLRTNITITPGMLIGPFQLQITPALASGLSLTIYRDTPKDATLVDFTDESGFSEVALDTNAKQAVFVAAEIADLVNTTDVAVAIELAGDAIAAAAVINAETAASSSNAAAALASANAAAASATLAGTRATAAGTSATGAATSATNAASSATAANSSAVAAAASASTAASAGAAAGTTAGGAAGTAAANAVVAGKADDAAVVKLTGPQNIGGTKVFTSVITVPTQAATDNSVNAASTAYARSNDLGVDQTWQDVTGSRVSGTTYTNSTGKPIMVCARTPEPTDNVTMVQLTISGIVIARGGYGRGGAGDNGADSVSGIVPHGATYSVSGFAGFYELR